MTDQADLVIENGRLITFDPETPRAQALAMRGGQILAVGSNAEIAELKARDTCVFDAQGCTVLPGFVESHAHLFPGAAELDLLDLSKTRGADALRAAVRAYADGRPNDPLIFAVSAGYDLLGKAATRADLDAACPDRPFAMMAHDHHTVWANTRALELAGLLQGRALDDGSEVVMGPDGLATGALLEFSAFGPVLAFTASGGRESAGIVTGKDPVPAPGAAERAADKATLLRGLTHCAAYGVTSIHNMDGNFYLAELLSELCDDGRRICRVQVPLHLKNTDPIDRLEEAEAMRRRFSDDWVYSGRVKMFMDGVIEARTAHMLAPYPGSDRCGEALFEADQFDAICRRADAAGLQISVHAIGDGAVRRTLDGYAAARRANGPRDSRHRIEHIEVLHPDDLPRFAELGVVASMQPLHSPAAGLFALNDPAGAPLLHDDQKPLSFPWRALRDTGAPLAFSTDWPVVPVDVGPSLRAAVAPTAGSGYEGQRQTLMEALESYTRLGAYAEFAEGRKGVLGPGRLADVVVLEQDLEAIDPATLDDMRAALTVAGGQVTHQA